MKKNVKGKTKKGKKKKKLSKKENQAQGDLEQLFISHIWIKTSTWSLKVHHAVQLLYSGNTNKNKNKKNKHRSQFNSFIREKTILSHLYKKKLSMYSLTSHMSKRRKRGAAWGVMWLLHQFRTLSLRHTHILSFSLEQYPKSATPEDVRVTAWVVRATRARESSVQPKYSWHSSLLAH